MTALFFLTIYLGLDRRNAYLFFFAHAVFQALSLFLLMTGQATSFLISYLFSNLSLLYFFAVFFHAARSKVIAIFAVAIAAIALVDLRFAGMSPKTIFFVIVWFIHALTLMICSWLALHALKNGSYAGRLLFPATALIFFLNIMLSSDSFLVSSMVVSSAMLILAVSYTVLRDIKGQQDLIKSLRTRAIHLENEMLKKSIQPHFLLNTLTVLSEWIEERPALAVQQIDLLSQEFRFITRVSGEKVIPLGEEIRICEVHLDIFNARQTKHFRLETRDIDAETKIPPMIFHTLIENGLTHADDSEGRFLIEQCESEKETVFRVSSEPLTEPKLEGEGLGMTYIKSRLEQAFPGRWYLTSEPLENAWRTTIGIKK